MPLPKESKEARTALRAFTRKYPDDPDLKSWVNIIRTQIAEAANRPKDEDLKRHMALTLQGFEQFLKRKNYTLP